MSFEKGTRNFIHLVNWPSTWLPPVNTRKVLLTGVNQQSQVDEVVAELQQDHMNTNWALYFDLEFDVDKPEHLDWHLINSRHCDAARCCISSPIELAIVLALTIPLSCVKIDNQEWSKIIQYSSLNKIPDVFAMLANSNLKDTH